ncbi:PAAR domain-containing protein [Paracoccus kondratievae]|uniref:PAAR domain-containing protein n=1 Tax=Paracoccus kondratievae TaxID=135740 RepID=UPI00187A9338|nr:PAAR domain-containing protein [Paracoccus kondratievae]
MTPLARLGDRHQCTLHGEKAITSVAGGSSCDARPIATVGDLTGCGAVIVTGSDSFILNGRRAAVVGSRTSHGGVVVAGSASAKA